MVNYLERLEEFGRHQREWHGVAFNTVWTMIVALGLNPSRQLARSVLRMVGLNPDSAYEDTIAMLENAQDELADFFGFDMYSMGRAIYRAHIANEGNADSTDVVPYQDQIDVDSGHVSQWEQMLEDNRLYWERRKIRDEARERKRSVNALYSSNQSYDRDDTKISSSSNSQSSLPSQSKVSSLFNQTSRSMFRTRGRVGDRVRALKRAKYSRAEIKGVVLKSEFGNSVSDPQCVYIGHSTNPGYLVWTTMLRSISKLILTRLGVQFNDWLSRFNQIVRAGVFGGNAYVSSTGSAAPDSTNTVFTNASGHGCPGLHLQLNLEYQTGTGKTVNAVYQFIIVFHTEVYQSEGATASRQAVTIPVTDNTGTNAVYALQVYGNNFYTTCDGTNSPEFTGTVTAPLIPVFRVLPSDTPEDFHNVMLSGLWEGQLFKPGSGAGFGNAYPEITIDKPPRIQQLVITPANFRTRIDTTAKIVHNIRFNTRAPVVLDLSSLYLNYSCTSVLRIQNTTLANGAPTDETADETTNVENNPIVGKYYTSGSARNFVRIGRTDMPSTQPYTTQLLSSGPADQTHGAILYTCHPFSGHISFGAKEFKPSYTFTANTNPSPNNPPPIENIPSYVINFYNKPPPPSYLGMKRGSGVSVDPGAIKYSRISDSQTIKFQDFFLSYWYGVRYIANTAENNNLTTKIVNIERLYMGRTALFAFEKYLDSRQDSGSVVRVGFQINFVMNCTAYCKYKKIPTAHIVITQPASSNTITANHTFTERLPVAGEDPDEDGDEIDPQLQQGQTMMSFGN